MDLNLVNTAQFSSQQDVTLPLGFESYFGGTLFLRNN
jgi:hypothetical protein